MNRGGSLVKKEEVSSEKLTPSMILPVIRGGSFLFSFIQQQPP